jgi:hypothetical protein
MSDTQQRHKHPHLLLNIVIIVLETFFSFILTHDATLRLQAKSLSMKKLPFESTAIFLFLTFMSNLPKKEFYLI